MKLVFFGVFLCVLSAVRADCERDHEIVCYWGSWSIYRRDIGFFNVSNINTDICTTIVYAFAGLDIKFDINSMDTNADITTGGYAKFVALKEKNPCLTTMLAIGGWNEGSAKYSAMAFTAERRKQFAESVLRFLITYKFDGIDIDWEYPTIRGGIPEDAKNFALLLKEIKSTIDPWGLKLSIAVSIDDRLIDSGYHIKEISEVVDFVNLMAYDYISSNSSVTGLSSPLSEIKLTVSKWLEGGLPPKKLVLGIPAYSKNFVLQDENQHGIGAPASIGRPGTFTEEDGLLAYYEVLEILNTINDVITETVDDTKYGYYSDEWFTYDDVTTVKTKVKFAIEQKLGGVMMWALELDDFTGIYGDAYPLLNAIKDTFNEYKAN